MPELQASRRLVKSPPELWAEVSDAGSLARHLGELGEIRITRLEPETTVAWEGERISGTVELASAGWGTAVTFTAAPIVADESEAAAEPEPALEPEPSAVVEPRPEPKLQPPPASVAEPDPLSSEPAPTRRSRLAALFRRRRQASAVATVESPPTPVDDEPEPAFEEPAVVEEPLVDPLAAMLSHALDSLGAAHHRPFSRG